MKELFALFLVFTLIYSCKSGKNEPKAEDADTGYVNLDEIPNSLKIKPVPDSIATFVNKDSVLRSLTKKVFSLIRDKKYAALDSLIHPEKGIRFSPYSYITAADKNFSRKEFTSLFGKNKNSRITWGAYDGSGDPIVLTAPEYFKKFVYDGNYVHPEKLQVNKIIGKGNTTNNIHSYYKGNDFTESYFSGSRKYDGQDWKSVRLIFKEINGKFYLVGVVHDQWTI